MTDGQEVWVAFTTDRGDHIIYKTIVLVAEHRVVQGIGGSGASALLPFQSAHATEAEALAACAARLRERARALDAKADAVAAKAVACGVGPANPE